MDLATSTTLAGIACYQINQPWNGSTLTLRFIFAFSAFYIVLKIYRVFIYPKLLSPLRKLPGPKDNHPLLGQALNVYNSTSPDLYIKWAQTWPDQPVIRSLDAGNQEVIVLNGVKAAKDVLQTHCYSFVKSNFLHRALGEITGTGLLFAEGPHHKKQRKLLAGPFSHGNIKQLLPFFASKAHELRANIESWVPPEGSKVIEVSSVLTHTTLDAIGLSALGLRFNNMTSPTEFSSAFEDVFSMDKSKLSTLMSVLNMYIPIRKLIPIKVNRDYLAANLRVRNLLRKRGMQRRQEMSDDKAEAKASVDMLSVLLRQREDGVVPWDDEEIVDHLLNFMSAGHETTAGSLTLSLYMLAKQPEVQDQLRNTIQQALPAGTEADYKTIDSLTLLSSVAKEVMRLYPPAIVFNRESVENVMIDNVMIPKGTQVQIVPSMIHYNPHVWGSNASEFDPGRWDHLYGDNADPYAFNSFGNGPRVCIGRSFGLLEYKVYLVEILRTFKFNLSNRPISFQRGGPSVRFQGGLLLDVQRLS